ncbi:ABC transporter substrate-binding protein [Blastococcus sp. SYSU DS1024]
MAHNSNPTSYDPQLGTSGFDHYLLYPMYDRLVNFDYDTLEPMPGLAESWEYTSPTELVFTLREGATFHDGTPVNASAVKYTIDRGINNPNSSVTGDLASVDTVEAVDDTTVKLTLNRPDTALPLILSDRAGMIVSEEAARANGDDLSDNPVGAGPFKFVSLVPAESLEVERFDDYWGESAHLDGIRFRIYKDAGTSSTTLLSGQSDFLNEVQIPDLDRLEASDSVEVAIGQTLAVNQCKFNLAEGPLTDPKVREALNLATDREAMNEVLNRGYGEPTSVALPSSHWAHPTGHDYDYDPDAARQLLADAGYEDDLTLTAVISASSQSPKMVEIMQAQFAEVGVTLEGQVQDYAQASEAFRERGEYDMFCVGWSGRPDPYQTFHATYAGESPYSVGYDSPDDVDAAIAATIVDQDTEARTEAFQSASALAQGEYHLHYFVAFRPGIQAYSTKVHGYEGNLYGKPILNQDVWMEQ